MLSDKYNSSSKQPSSQTRSPGWGYGLGGTSQAASDVSDPSFESLSPPQPLTPYAGVLHDVEETLCTETLLVIMLSGEEPMKTICWTARHYL